MATLEQELMEKISHLNENQQRRILEIVEMIEHADAAERNYTARELMQLPFEERNRIAKAALNRSLDEDVELFEAFGEADFHDE